ncbi:hypothetical protein HDU67_004136 [Dinochytrium kinnereticum]|nr:hypothetical protein HDU67_004136 [Dinochytrium kinnereticum]
MTRREPPPRLADDSGTLHDASSQSSLSSMVAGFTPKIKSKNTSLTGTISSPGSKARKISSVTSLPSLEATASPTCLTGIASTSSTTANRGSSGKATQRHKKRSRSRRSGSGRSGGPPRSGASSTSSNRSGNRIRLPSVVMNGSGGTSIVRAAPARTMLREDADNVVRKVSSQGYSSFSYRSDMSLSRSYVESTALLSNIGHTHGPMERPSSHRESSADGSHVLGKKERIQDDSRRSKVHRLKKVDASAIPIAPLSSQFKDSPPPETTKSHSYLQKQDSDQPSPPSSHHRNSSRVGHHYLRSNRQSIAGSLHVTETDGQESDLELNNDSFGTIAPWKKGNTSTSRETSALIRMTASHNKAMSSSSLQPIGSSSASTKLVASKSNIEIARSTENETISTSGAPSEAADSDPASSRKTPRKPTTQQSTAQRSRKVAITYNPQVSDPELPSISTLESMASPDFLTMKEMMDFSGTALPGISSTSGSPKAKPIPLAVESENVGTGRGAEA